MPTKTNHFALAALAGLRMTNGARHRAYHRAAPALPFHPHINRHTGKPHAHAREIARHLRQKGAGE